MKAVSDVAVSVPCGAAAKDRLFGVYSGGLELRPCCVGGLFFFVILRFGLLAGTVCNVTQVLFNAFIVTPELSSWHADATIAAILATLAISSFGLYISTIRPLTAAPGRAPV